MAPIPPPTSKNCEKPKNSKPEQDGLRSKSEKESASRALRERVACSENMS